METIHLIIKESVSGNFGVFLGYVIMTALFIGLPIRLISLFFDFIFKLFNRSLRHWNIRKHGYPPSHCDADGDFKDNIE